MVIKQSLKQVFLFCWLSPLRVNVAAPENSHNHKSTGFETQLACFDRMPLVKQVFLSLSCSITLLCNGPQDKPRSLWFLTQRLSEKERRRGRGNAGKHTKEGLFRFTPRSQRVGFKRQGKTQRKHGKEQRATETPRDTMRITRRKQHKVHYVHDHSKPATTITKEGKQDRFEPQPDSDVITQAYK